MRISIIIPAVNEESAIAATLLPLQPLRQAAVELIVVDGKVEEIRIGRVPGRKPLGPAQLRDFQLVVEQYAEEIVQKWIDYFILHRQVSSENLTRRIR